MADYWDDDNGNDSDNNENQEQDPQESEYDDPPQEEQGEETFQSAQTVPATEPLSPPPQHLDHQEVGVGDPVEVEEGESEEEILPLPPIPDPEEAGSSDEYHPSSSSPPPSGGQTPETAPTPMKKQTRQKPKSSQSRTDDAPSPPPRLEPTIPASTYLSHTRSLRDTLATLSAERAADLGANLFVAFAIRKHALRQSLSQSRQQRRLQGSASRSSSRSRSRSVSSTTKRTRRSKSKGKGKGKGKAPRNHDSSSPSSSSGDDPSGREGPRTPVFIPPKTWTAWPMDPESVPRTFHTDPLLHPDGDAMTFTEGWEGRWGRGTETDRIKERMGDFDGGNKARLKFREELEGWIIATITRVGRERWEGREWEEDANDISRDGGEVQMKNVYSSDAHNRVRKDSSSSSPAPEMFSSQQPAPSHRHHQRPPDHQMSSSTSHSSSPSQSPSPPPPTQGYIPLPLSSSDTADTLLLPPTRRIIAQLDKLLLGLHHMRAAQAYSNSKSKRKRAEDDTEAQTTQTEDDRSRRTSRSGKGKGKRRTVQPSGGDETTDAGSGFLSSGNATSSNPGHRRTGHRNKHRSDKSARSRERDRLARLGLRDWSDVLGTAAVVGWDSDVLARAGQRCARLFGEGMGFRTLREPGGGRGRVEEWGVGPGGVWGCEDGGVEEEEDSEDRDGIDDGDRSVEDVEGIASSGGSEEDEESEGG